jgi:hypothetical protein
LEKEKSGSKDFSIFSFFFSATIPSLLDTPLLPEADICVLID